MSGAVDWSKQTATDVEAVALWYDLIVRYTDGWTVPAVNVSHRTSAEAQRRDNMTYKNGQYKPTLEQQRAMYPDGHKVNDMRNLCTPAAALGFTANRVTGKEQGSGMLKPPTKKEHEGWGCMRMRSMTPETVCIADGIVFISEDEARKYGNEMLTNGYVISHVTWSEENTNTKAENGTQNAKK